MSHYSLFSAPVEPEPLRICDGPGDVRGPQAGAMRWPARSSARTLPAGVGGWQHDDVDYLLAQVNVGRMREPLDSPLLADFVAALDPVNAAADAAPGFVWRLQTEDGNATAVHAFEWDQAGSAGVLVNMSVWESVEALAAYVYSDTHRQVLRRRRQWFERMTEAYAARVHPQGALPAAGRSRPRADPQPGRMDLPGLIPGCVRLPRRRGRASGSGLGLPGLAHEPEGRAA